MRSLERGPHYILQMKLAGYFQLLVTDSTLGRNVKMLYFWLQILFTGNSVAMSYKCVFMHITVYICAKYIYVWEERREEEGGGGGRKHTCVHDRDNTCTNSPAVPEPLFCSAVPWFSCIHEPQQRSSCTVHKTVWCHPNLQWNPLYTACIAPPARKFPLKCLVWPSRHKKPHTISHLSYLLTTH